MFQGDIGDQSASGLVLVALTIPPSATVTVKNVAGATVNYYSDGADSPTPGTITTGNSTSFTLPPVYIAADLATGGRSSIQITGGNY